MANLVKSFINHYGLDLKSSDIVREPQYASDMLNAQYKKNGNIGKREGYRAVADTVGGFGLFTYNRINNTTAKVEEMLLSVSDRIHLLKKSVVTVSYTGSETSCVFDIFFDTASNVYRAQVVEGTTLVLNFSLGVGVDETVPVTLADLETAIEAISGDFAVTITGDTSVPAAFIDLERALNLFDEDSVLEARYWEDANARTTLLPGNLTNKDDEDMYLTTAIQLNNNMYLTNGYDNVIKFDGQNAYRAGMPTSDAPVAALGAAGALSPTNPYIYTVLYTQIDANLNEVSGNMSADSNALTPVAQTVDVTVDNILDASGFNTNAAIVAGAQVGVNTITVDDGSGGNHTMVVGDTAYFFDGVSGGYVERNISAVTAGTITIDGSAVDVADNAVISNNLRIGIYRNQDGGTFKFLVEEIPNNPFVATQVYNDNTLDANLGIQFIEPLSPRDLPPKGRYISSYNNQAFIAGDLESPNTVAWSAVESPEYWAPNVFSLRIQSPNGDKITGLSQSNEIMTVFEKRATHVISGDIPNNNLRVDTITKDIGCVSHNTIREVRGSLYFLSDRGVWKTVSGQLPLQVSKRIEPVFEQDNLIDDDQILVMQRAFAVNDRENEQYILYLPAEQTVTEGIYANEFSFIYTEDYYRGAWLKWNNMNMAGGATVFEGKVTFQERRLNSSLGPLQVSAYLYAKNNRGDNYDFNDNTSPVEFEYKTAWYNFNEPSVFKKFLRYKIFATEETAQNEFILDIDIEKDFINDFVIGDFQIDFSGAVGGYGISAYGTSAYGDIFDPNRKYKIGPIKAKSLRFVLKNDTQLENVDITGWEIDVAMPYRQEMKE